MNLLHLFNETERRLESVKAELEATGDNEFRVEHRKQLKDEKEYLLSILAILFKELER